MDRVILKNEAGLIIRSSAILAVILLSLHFIHPLVGSHEKLHIFLHFGQYVIFILFILVFLVWEWEYGMDQENGFNNRNDQSFAHILLVDFCSILLSISLFLILVLFFTSQMEVDLKQIQRPQSYISRLLKKPTPEEQTLKIMENYYENSGFFSLTVRNLSISFMLVSILRFLIVLTRLVVKHIATFFRNRNR